MKRLRLLLVLVLGVVLLAAVRTPVANADTSAVTVTGYECRAFGGSGQLWPVVKLKRNSYSGDNRMTSNFYLYDGTKLVQSLTGGEVADDGVTGSAGVVTIGTGETVELAPWAGHFGDPSVVAGYQALDPRKTYRVEFRAFDFGADDYSWQRNITCGFCDGVTLKETLGNDARVKAGKKTSTYTNSSAACGGYWLDKSKKGFTPQGLALEGRTAWTSGYVKDTETCYVQRTDLVSGKVLLAPVKLGSGCKHAGGLALLPQGLLVVDTSTLYLVKKSSPGTVLKKWPIARLSVKDDKKIGTCPAPSRKPATRAFAGSFLVTGATGQIGLGTFSDGDCGGVWTFDVATLLKHDGWRLNRITAGKADGKKQLYAKSYKSAAYKANGGALRGGKLWSTGSRSTCGQLVAPSGAKGFAPGAEEIEFDAAGFLWGVFEASSASYPNSGKTQPMLTMFDPAKLTKAGGRCS